MKRCLHSPMNSSRFALSVFAAGALVAASMAAFAQTQGVDRQLRVVGFSLPTEQLTSGGIARAIQQARASGQVEAGDMPLDEAMMRLLVQAGSDAENDLRGQVAQMDRAGSIAAPQRMQAMRQLDASRAMRHRIEAKLAAREQARLPPRLAPQARNEWWSKAKASAAPAVGVAAMPAATEQEASAQADDGESVDVPGQDAQAGLQAALARVAQVQATMQALVDAFDGGARYLIIDGK